jgi:hypothetical protein
MNQRIGFLAALTILGTLIGCAPREVAPTGPREATTADAINIYQKRPQRYEDLGVVTVPIGGHIRMDSHGDATAGFIELKKKAAALGANGLLLDDKKVQADAWVTAGYKGQFYQVPLQYNPKLAKAHAIWVHEE